MRTPLNQAILYDLGSTKEFKPLQFISKNFIPFLDSYEANNKQFRIAQIVLSHPHVDHIQEIESIEPEYSKKAIFHPRLLTCPHDKTIGTERPEAVRWDRINNPAHSVHVLGAYRSLFQGRRLPLQTIEYRSNRYVPNLEYGIYYMRPPVVDRIFPENDQQYTNGLSIVFYLRHGKHSILIPGDICPPVLHALLAENEGSEKRYTVFDRQSTRDHPEWHCKAQDQPSLRENLRNRGLSVLIAPHHGLESGWSDTLYSEIAGRKPGLVVISEKRHTSDQDGAVELTYQSRLGSFGQPVHTVGGIENHYSVSTRGGHILIVFDGSSRREPDVFVEVNPDNLLLHMT